MSGIVLLALAGAFQMLALKPLEQEVKFMHSRMDEAHAKTSMQNRTFSLGDRQKELGMFFDSLPTEQDVTDILASIYSVAEASGVQLQQAGYHPESDDNSRIDRRFRWHLSITLGRRNISAVIPRRKWLESDRIIFLH